MKNSITLLTALLFVTSATFASINIDVDTKKDRIEIQSTDSHVYEVTLNKLEGGLLEANITTPSDNIVVSTKNLNQGVYLIKAKDLNGNKNSRFINVN